jgi:hypothetical protein
MFNISWHRLNLSGFAQWVKIICNRINPKYQNIMASINASQLNQKINQLPDNLLQEVNDFIEYLAFKSSQKDWANDLSKEQILLIENGKKDIKKNKVVSHKEARKRIENYIKEKTS